MTTFRAPRAAPAFHSPIVAAFASLSIPTGRPCRCCILERKSTPSSGMFTEATARPVRWSIREGRPKPSAATSCPTRRVSTTTSSALSNVSCEEMSVSYCLRDEIEPSGAIRAPRIFVPPTSTPMTCVRCTHGYHTPPNGVARRREAVSPLPRRARQGPRADGERAEAAAAKAAAVARRPGALPGARPQACGRRAGREEDPLGPRDRDRDRARRALPRLLGAARLPDLPRWRLSGEQAAATVDQKRAHAGQRLDA